MNNSYSLEQNLPGNKPEFHSVRTNQTIKISKPNTGYKSIGNRYFQKYDDISVPCIVVADGLKITYANHASRTLFNTAGIVQKKLSKIVHPLDKMVLFRHYRDLLKSNETKSCEFRIITGDGKVRNVFCTTKQPVWPGKYKRVYLSSLVDITSSVYHQDKLKKKFANKANQYKQSKERLRNLIARQNTLIEKERTRISREIHDELGQSLTSLRIDMDWLRQKLPPRYTRLHERLGSMQGLVRSSLDTVRSVVTRLRPSILDDLGLVAAIEWASNEFSRRTGIKVEYSYNFDDMQIMLHDNIKTAIFRIFQEATTNVARHSKADHVRISLECDEDTILLQVKDNGIGFVQNQDIERRSLGLLGIKERVKKLNGEFTLTKRNNDGLGITVCIPLISKRKSKDLDKHIYCG